MGWGTVGYDEGRSNVAGISGVPIWIWDIERTNNRASTKTVSGGGEYR